MGNDWKQYCMKDVTLGIFDGPHATPKKTITGPIFLGISSLNQGRLDFSKKEHLSDQDYKKWTKRVTPQKDDLVFSYETRLGEVAIIPEGIKCCLGRRLALARPDKTILEPRYFLYYYLSPQFQDFLKSRTISGSTVDRILLTEFSGFPIKLPSLAIQKAIAEILGALDDKIELNRQMNQTVEQMALALFKSWFVDFDPVGAKAAGKKPFGLSDEEAALFPEKFEDSELGPIPKGWKIGLLKDRFNIKMGQSPPGKTYNESGEGLPFFQGRTDFGFRYPLRRIYCNAPTRVASPGDTLLTVRAPVGDLNMAIEECCIGRGLATVGHVKGFKSFTYYTMKSIKDDLNVFNGEGTLFGSINKSSIESIKIACSSPDLEALFEKKTSSLDELILSNTKEIDNLRDIRNTLLPKLISAEIRIKNAEKMVTEAL